MGRPRSKRRFDVLAALRQNPRASYRELMAETGISNISMIHYYLVQLEDEGLIDRKVRLARSLSIRRPGRKHDSPGTREKKSAAGRKGKILDKKVAGIDSATWKRIEKIGQREDRRRLDHSTDVVCDFHVRGSQGLKCSKLG